MSPTIQDLMHEAVREAHPDLPALTDRSRRRGMAIRRRRQALGTIGAAAAIGVLALGGVTVVDDLRSSGGSAAGQPGSPGDTVELDGKIAAGMLLDDLLGLEDGAAGKIAGHGSGGDVVTARLWWFPHTDGHGSVVGVEVTPGANPPELDACGKGEDDCRVTHPSPGTTLKTFQQDVGAGGVQSVASVLRPDGVHVAAYATSSYDARGDGWVVVQARPAISTETLAEIALRPEWTARVGAGEQDAARRIADGYQDLETLPAEAFPGVTRVPCQQCHRSDR